MPFLDSNGLQTYTAKLKNLLNGFVPVTRKVNNKALITDITLTAEDIPNIPYYTPSVSEDGDLGWTNNGNLPDPDMVNIKGPKGDKGPDGSPIGTVISYMGHKAPKDYLICDGTIYNIADYQDLANFFQEEMGSKNYFGGNGATTFAVPDLRNLFLRGYHGTASALSGNIGVKQEATEIPNISIFENDVSTYASLGAPHSTTQRYFSKNWDSTIGYAKTWSPGGLSDDSLSVSSGTPFSYTSRPVNMAVLYCIKAIESTSMASGGIDSITDEQIDALFSAG